MKLETLFSTATSVILIIGVVIGCVKPVHTTKSNSTSSTICPEPPEDAFRVPGLDLSFASSTFAKVAVGDIKIKNNPQVISLVSQAARDRRITDYVRCLAINRDHYTLEQAAYLELFNAFTATGPTPQQFIDWQKANPFPTPAPTTSAPEKKSELVSATISFQTVDDDKDDNTKLSLRLYSKKELAATLDYFQVDKFEDNPSSTRLLDLTIIPSATREEFSKGKLTVIIDPKGHDTWYFIPTLTLKFTSGDPIVRLFPKQMLSENKKSLDLDF